MKPAETALLTSLADKLSLFTCKLDSNVLTFSSNFLLSNTSFYAPSTVRPNNIEMLEFGAEKGLRKALQGGR